MAASLAGPTGLKETTASGKLRSILPSAMVRLATGTKFCRRRGEKRADFAITVVAVVSDIEAPEVNEGMGDESVLCSDNDGPAVNIVTRRSFGSPGSSSVREGCNLQFRISENRSEKFKSGFTKFQSRFGKFESRFEKSKSRFEKC
jgi:hypothetical protein